MTYFAKPANLARTETMKQQNRHIDSDLHKNGKFKKMGIGQESINGLAKSHLR